MMQQPTFRSTWLPLGLALAALIVLNIGLYTRLAAQPSFVTFSLPYATDYHDGEEITRYEQLSGDWEVRDETLVQLSTSGFDLGILIPLDIPAEQPYRFETSLRSLSGANGGGIVFNAQQTNNRQQSHMARFNVDNGQLWLVYGYFGDDSNFVGQGSALLNLTADSPGPHRLGVQTSGNSYAMLLDGQVISADIPLHYQGGSVGMMTTTSQVAFDDVSVEAIDPAQAAISVTTNPMAVETATPPALVINETFDNSANADTPWNPISGDWRFEPGALVQAAIDGFDLSIGNTQPVNLPYTMRATFEHQSGTGGGVLFNMPQPDSKNGAYLARYFENGEVLAWGYFDEAGVFNGQGSTAVPAPGSQSQTLEIAAGLDAYTVRLNDIILVENVPYVTAHATGYIGLTSSQSSARFRQVEVLEGTNISTPNPGSGFDLSAASASWIVADNLITQTGTEQTDYIAGTGVAAASFTVSVDILLPTDETLADAGAGLIFHMSSRDDPSGGNMVRFSRGGREVFWGSFDENRVFQGQGSAPLELAAGVPHRLTLVVRAGSYGIQVDDQLIAEALPTSQPAGWLGLVSFRGPVEFSNVRLTLEEP